jgi:hypothetical protein
MTAPRRIVTPPPAPPKRPPGRPPGSKNKPKSVIGIVTVQAEANQLLAVAQRTRKALHAALLNAEDASDETGTPWIPSTDFLQALRFCRETVKDMGTLDLQLQGKQLRDAANLSDDELQAAIQQAARETIAALPLEELLVLVEERRAGEGGDDERGNGHDAEGVQ